MKQRTVLAVLALTMIVSFPAAIVGAVIDNELIFWVGGVGIIAATLLALVGGRASQK